MSTLSPMAKVALYDGQGKDVIPKSDAAVSPQVLVQSFAGGANAGTGQLQTENRSVRRPYLMCCCAIIVAIIVTVVGISKLDFGRRFSEADDVYNVPVYKDGVDALCYGNAQAWFNYAYLIGVVSFGLFVQARQYKSNTPTWPAGLYVGLDVLYIVCDTLQFYECGQRLQFSFYLPIRILTYGMNCAIVYWGKYDNLHQHYESLYLLAMVFGMELTQITWEGGYFHDFGVFVYFNVKIALFIFEAWAGSDWTELLQLDGDLVVKQLVFFIYITGKLLKQFYYASSVSRSIGIYIAGGAFEFLTQLFMLSTLLYPDFREKLVGKEEAPARNASCQNIYVKLTEEASALDHQHYEQVLRLLREDGVIYVEDLAALDAKCLERYVPHVKPALAGQIKALLPALVENRINSGNATQV